MKSACIILSIIILVAIMAVCVMVKFATDINVDEKRRDYLEGGGIYHFARSMGVISLNDNSSTPIAERFPYLAAVTKNSSTSWAFSCFASVILTKWIVTSAHCRTPGATHRVLLYHDLQSNYTNTYAVLFWRLHEKFNSSNPTPRFDVAVAKLNVDRYPFTIKAASFEESIVYDLEASIWKTVSMMNRRTFLTNDLEKFDFRIAAPSKCYEAYGIEVDESLVCVDMSKYEDCFVNEFGPLFSGGRVVGVLAVKPRDCDVKLSIFTNVSYYSNWILRSTHTTYYG